MTFLPTTTPTPYRLIRILFYLLCTVITVALLLFFFLHVHQTVSATSGKIITENAPQSYLAPYAAEVKSVKVKMGEPVEKGQVLLELNNPVLNVQIEQVTEEITGVTIQLEHLQKLQKNLITQRDSRQRRSGNLERGFSYQQERTRLELSALRSQLADQRQRLVTARQRLQVDQEMLAEGLLSKSNYLTRQEQFAQEQQLFTELNKRYQQERNQRGEINNQRDNHRNAQSIAVLGVEKQIIETAQTITLMKSQQSQLQQQLEHLQEERAKSIITAHAPGYVTQLFNEYQEMNRVTTHLSLLTIRPTAAERFYAKLAIPQTAVKDVKMGQRTQIRLPAYNYHRYGVLSGEVIHVDRDTSNQFYALVAIPEQETSIELKNGFSATGRIITDKVRLCTYIYRELLN